MLTNTKNVDRYLINTTPLATYSIDFPYWDKAEIKVYLTLSDGNLATLTEGTNYTLSAPNGENGTLTRVGDWTAGATNLTIVREMPLTQEVDLRNGDKIDAETIEQAYDTLTAQVQQISEQQSRSFTTSIDEEGSNLTFPNKTERAGTGEGTIMGFGPDGDTVVLRDLAGFDADVQSAADNAASSEVSKVKASEWASKFNDVDPGSTLPVEDGKYSSRKYAYDSEQKAVVSEAKALVSEGFANGQQNGQDVDPTSPYYHNNSKYWNEQAQSVVLGKADKAVPSTVHNLAGLDATGNLEDSGFTKESIELMQSEIAYLRARGRFLSLWSCVTGAPVSFPLASPYAYQTGDYFIVSAVGSTNYRPDGASYTTGDISTVVETSTVNVNDTYYYDGDQWLLLSGANIAAFSSLVGKPTDNSAMKKDLNAIQGVSQYYSELETYSIGDRRINPDDGVEYRCKTAVSTPEAFDQSKWEAVDLASLDGAVTSLSADFATLIKSKPISATTDSNGNIDVYNNGGVPIDAKPLYFVQTTTVDAWIVPFMSINGHPHIHATNWNGSAKGSTAISGTLYYLV